MFLIFEEEEKQYVISITKDITSYEREFYKYVTYMSQLVIEEDFRRHMYVCKQYHLVQ